MTDVVQDGRMPRRPPVFLRRNIVQAGVTRRIQPLLKRTHAEPRPCILQLSATIASHAAMLAHSSEQPSAVRRWNEDGSLDAKDSELWVEHSPARVPVSFVVVLTQLPARAQSAWQDSRMERVEHRAATATSGQHTHDPLYYVLGSVVVAPSGHPKSVLAAANAKLRRASSPAHAAAEPVAEADEDEHDLDHAQRAPSSARCAERTSSSAAMVARTRNGRKGKPAADAGVRGEKKTASPEHGAPAAAAHLVGSTAASSQSVAPDASSVTSETVSTHGLGASTRAGLFLTTSGSSGGSTVDATARAASCTRNGGVASAGAAAPPSVPVLVTQLRIPIRGLHSVCGLGIRVVHVVLPRVPYSQAVLRRLRRPLRALSTQSTEAGDAAASTMISSAEAWTLSALDERIKTIAKNACAAGDIERAGVPASDEASQSSCYFASHRLQFLPSDSFVHGVRLRTIASHHPCWHECLMHACSDLPPVPSPRPVLSTVRAHATATKPAAHSTSGSTGISTGSRRSAPSAPAAPSAFKLFPPTPFTLRVQLSVSPLSTTHANISRVMSQLIRAQYAASYTAVSPPPQLSHLLSESRQQPRVVPLSIVPTVQRTPLTALLPFSIMSEGSPPSSAGASPHAAVGAGLTSRDVAQQQADARSAAAHDSSAPPSCSLPAVFTELDTPTASPLHSVDHAPSSLVPPPRLVAMAESDTKGSSAPFSSFTSTLIPTSSPPATTEHQRCYFHSRTGALLHEDDLEFDSDDDDDAEQRLRESLYCLQAFDDVSPHDAAFMALWNKQVYERAPTGDFCMPTLCETFAASCGQEIMAKGLYDSFLYHLLLLWEQQLLSSRQLLRCLHTVRSVSGIALPSHAVGPM